MTLRADAQRNLERVLVVAGECFAERGLDVSIDEIARRAGVGHGTVFRRFPTKDALVQAVFGMRIRELVESAQAAAEEPDAGEAFGRFFRHIAVLYRDNLSLIEGLERCTGSPDKGELLEAVQRIVAGAQKAGALRRDVTAEDVLRLVPAGAQYPEIVLDGLRAYSGLR
jgi:AcrR family transcriptional regulator